MPLRLVAAGKSDIGLQREQNEDSYFTKVIDSDHPASGILIVSDGMGGYHAGEIASQLAVETIRDDLLKIFTEASDQTTVKLNKGRGRKNTKSRKREAPVTKPLTEDGGESEAAAITTPTATVTEDSGESSDEGEDGEDSRATHHLLESVALEHYADKLRVAVEHSSQAIEDYGAKHREARGMGATVTVALVMDGQAFVANVGDSRTYLVRDGKIERLTRDHSLVERLVEAGQITPEEVYDHPSRNLIYRSLGAGHAAPEVDIFVEKLRPGDTLLLCSDGLWEMVRDPQLQQIITEHDDLKKACERLISMANENGGEDNITAVLARCLEA
ncbi:MAG TPA: PP2C family serine/threonine-protein phosphatase [Ktedonobacterales bacterium]